MEEVFSEALGIFGAEMEEDDGYVHYGGLKLGVVPKEGKAITVMANALFSPSILLAECIETGQIVVEGRTIVELGAGSALPSLLAATLPNGRHASLVVATEYPDPVIMKTLKGNVERARLQRGKPHPTFEDGAEGSEEKEGDMCRIECAEYEWGSDVSHLLQFLPSNPSPGFDIVIMSDLLHFDSSHTALVNSLIALLSKSRRSTLYVAAGKYTKQEVCDRFIDETLRAGISLVEESQDRADWQGHMAVRGQGLDREGLTRRRDASRLWVGRWIGRMAEQTERDPRPRR